MKALLLKDFYTLWSQMKFILLMFALFAAVPSVFQNTFAVLYASILPYTALAYDEHSRWDQLAAMMPYSVKALVLSKYVLGWAAGGAAFLLCTLVQTLVSSSTGTEPQVTLLFLAFCGGVLIDALTLPLLFRFGVQKGRVMTCLIVGLVCALAGGISTAGAMSVLYGGAEIALGVCALAACASAALSALSVRLSVKLYGRRG